MAEQDELTHALDASALRLVRAIADTGGITAAADALGYSQPAISQQLRRLEARLGVPLVERVGRGVRLTEAGDVLARHASGVATVLEAAAGELADLRGLRSGRVRLIGFPSASPTVIPRVLADLARRHPGVVVTYVEAEPPEAVEAVRQDRADIALTFSYPGDLGDPHGPSAHGLAVDDVGSDRLLAVLPVGHARAGRTELRIADLAGESWIAGCPRCRGHLLQACERAGFTPRIAFETDNVVAVEALVARGIGVATLPRMALEAFPLLPGVATVELAADEARTLHVVTAHGAQRVPAVGAALGAVGRALAERASGAER